MARAYCLTCNEQVVETPSGTCPLGHPVAAQEPGPEPWVGFAGETMTDQADPHHADVPMDRVDANGRVHAHAGVNGHVNGAANGHAPAFAPMPPPTRDPVSDDLTDDLSALLAEALGSSEAPPTDAAVPQPAPPVDPAHPEAVADEDWDDLAHLAAELQLGDDIDSDDGPSAAAPPPAPADVDDLLAELTGGVSRPDGAPRPDPAAPVDEPVAEAPLFEDPTPLDAVPPSLDDVPSAPTAEPVDIWAEADAEVEAVDQPVDEAPPAGIDLSNFTARGKRVGDGGSRPATKKRKWKR